MMQASAAQLQAGFGACIKAECRGPVIHHDRDSGIAGSPRGQDAAPDFTGWRRGGEREEPVVGPMTRCLIVLALAMTSLAVAPVRPCAAELLMYQEQGCVWCRRWNTEVGPAYSKSAEGRRAPLRRIDIHGPEPVDVVLSAPVRATPTFVLVESGREVGRITGYPGADFFWGMLEGLIAKLEPERLPTAPQGDRAAATAERLGT